VTRGSRVFNRIGYAHIVDVDPTTTAAPTDTLRSPWTSTSVPGTEYLDRFADGTWLLTSIRRAPETFPTLAEPSPDNSTTATYNPTPANSDRLIIGFDATGTATQLTRTSAHIWAYRDDEGAVTFYSGDPSDMEHYRSTDAGATFEDLPDANLVTKVADLFSAFMAAQTPTENYFRGHITSLGIWPDGNATLLFSLACYTTTKNYYLRTTDGGTTWTTSLAPSAWDFFEGESARHSLKNSSVRKFREFADRELAPTTHVPTILTTSDKGTTWTKTTDATEIISPRLAANNVIAYLTGSTLQVTEDNGATWITATPPAAAWDFVFSVFRQSKNTWAVYVYSITDATIKYMELSYKPGTGTLATRLTWGTLTTITWPGTLPGPADFDQVPGWVNDQKTE